MMNEKLTFRNHFLSVFANLSGLIVLLIIIFVRDPRGVAELIIEIISTSGAGVPLLIGAIATVIIIGVTVYIQIRRWKRTFIIIDGTNLIVHQATLVQRDYVIAMQNISSINQEQTLVHKILGLYNIGIDTNTTATADETDVSILLGHDRAEEFCTIIESRMKELRAAEGAAEKVEGFDAVEDDDWDVMYSPKETIIHSILSTGLLGLIIGIGAIILAFVLTDEIELSSNGLVNILLSIIIVIAAIWSIIGASIKKYLLYCNFKAKRVGDDIIMSYGLTTTRRFRVPVDKINTVYIRQSELGRILKMQEVHISAIGMGDDENEIKNVLLYGTMPVIRSNLEKLLPEFMSYYDGDVEHKEKKLKLIDIAVSVLTALVACIIILTFVPVETHIKLAACAGGLALVLLIVSLRNITAGIHIADTGLKIRSGIFGIKDTLVDYNRIQTVAYEAGPILRKLGMAKGTITLFGGVTDLVVVTEAFSEEYFDRIAEKTVETDCFKIY